MASNCPVADTDLINCNDWVPSSQSNVFEACTTACQLQGFVDGHCESHICSHWWIFHYDWKECVCSEEEMPGGISINLGDTGTGHGDSSSNDIVKEQQLKLDCQIVNTKVVSK